MIVLETFIHRGCTSEQPALISAQMRSAHRRDLAISKAKFPASGLFGILGAKYKVRILWDLQQGSRRYGEIRKRLSLGAVDTKAIAPRVLSRELKSLTELGLIHRKSYNVIPPRVEYRLTALGRSVLPVISKILEWGTRHPLRSQFATGASLIRSESSAASPPSLSPPMKKEGS